MEMKLVKMPGFQSNEIIRDIACEVMSDEERKQGWHLARLEHVFTFIKHPGESRRITEGVPIMAPGKLRMVNCGSYTHYEAPAVNVQNGEIHLSEKRVTRSGESFVSDPCWRDEYVLIVKPVRK